jgi:hypothetical protein
MRERELDRFLAMHPDADLAEDVARWRKQYPDGSLADAVTDLGLWPRNPRDRDVQWFVWRRLYELGDPVAREAGFQAMCTAARRASTASARHRLS